VGIADHIRVAEWGDNVNNFLLGHGFVQGSGTVGPTGGQAKM